MPLNRHQQIVASLVLQRNPLRMRRLSDFEQAYMDYCEAVRSEQSKGLFEIKAGTEGHAHKNTNVFGIPKMDGALVPAKELPEAPLPTDSLSRLPERKLYLLVKAGSSWTLPRWTVGPEEHDGPLSRVLQQKSNQYFGGSPDIYFVGKAPVAHHLERFADRTLPPFSAVHFFFKAQFVAGAMQVPHDYCWLSSEEVKATVPKGYWGAIRDVVSY